MLKTVMKLCVMPASLRSLRNFMIRGETTMHIPRRVTQRSELPFQMKVVEYIVLAYMQSPTWRCLVIGSLVHVADLPDRRALCSAGCVLLCHHAVKLSTVAIKHSQSPLPNSGTACLTTSCWRIRCRPFGAN